MNLKDLFTAWNAAVHSALLDQAAPQEPQDEQLLDAAGLQLRTGLLAGNLLFGGGTVTKGHLSC